MRKEELHIYEEVIKPALRICIGGKTWEELYSGSAKMPFCGDLSLYCIINLPITRSNKSPVFVTDKMLAEYGISKEQLFQDALEQSVRRFPPTLVRDDLFWAVSVEGFMYGASALAYPGFLDEAARKIGEGFFISPYSVHGVLLLPESFGLSAEELGQVLKEELAGVLGKEARLADYIIHYDPKTKKLETTDPYEGRC